VRLTEVFRYSAGAKLAGVIYVHRISDDKFGGLAVRNFRMLRELCGEKTLKNVILMTSKWGRVTPQEGADREQQLKDKYFKAAIEKGAQLCRYTNTPESAQAILRTIFKNEPLVLQIQHELVDQGKDIGQTGAGEELNREIREAVEMYQREIGGLEEDMQEAMMEKDEESREELEEERRRKQEEMEKLREDSTEMESKFEKARREMEERINTMFEAQMKQIQDAYKAQIREYEVKVNELLREGRESAAPQIDSMKKVMIELRRKATVEFRKKANEAKRCIIM